MCAAPAITLVSGRWIGGEIHSCGRQRLNSRPEALSRAKAMALASVTLVDHPAGGQQPVRVAFS
jgi:hypothetical protein